MCINQAFTKRKSENPGTMYGICKTIIYNFLLMLCDHTLNNIVSAACNAVNIYIHVPKHESSNLQKAYVYTYRVSNDLTHWALPSKSQNLGVVFNRLHYSSRAISNMPVQEWCQNNLMSEVHYGHQGARLLLGRTCTFWGGVRVQTLIFEITSHLRD